MDLMPGDIPSISTQIDRHNDLGKAILKALRGPLDEIDRDEFTEWVKEAGQIVEQLSTLLNLPLD